MRSSGGHKAGGTRTFKSIIYFLKPLESSQITNVLITLTFLATPFITHTSSQQLHQTAAVLCCFPRREAKPFAEMVFISEGSSGEFLWVFPLRAKQTSVEKNTLKAAAMSLPVGLMTSSIFCLSQLSFVVSVQCVTTKCCCRFLFPSDRFQPVGGDKHFSPFTRSNAPPVGSWLALLRQQLAVIGCLGTGSSSEAGPFSPLTAAGCKNG